MPIFFLNSENYEQLKKLCLQHNVKRLELFGSACSEKFDPATSDLDFLVNFGTPPAGMDSLDQYQGFLESLQKLFGRSVDLVDETSIRNRFFRQAIEQTKVPLYAA